MGQLNSKTVAAWLGALAMATAPALGWAAEEAEAPPPQVLIKNVNVFDGKSDALAMGRDVLVTGNMITQVAAGVSAPSGATVIDGGGRTLSRPHLQPSFSTAYASASAGP